MNPAVVKQRREKLGLTQLQAAERAGMPQPSYARIESGKRKDPAFTTVERIADALGLTLDQMRLKPTKSRPSPSRKPRKA